MKLIIATKNESKLKEIQKLFEGLDVKVLSLRDLAIKFYIREDGKTFRENAIKKAIPVSERYRDAYVVGEDSGLEVAYLDGAPGVHSKRYASKDGSQAKNNTKLLKKLTGVSSKDRDAQFICCCALAKGGELLKTFEGRLPGKISRTPCGGNGFGYDPVFYLPQYKKTAAQLTLAQKNKMSHRYKAFKKLKAYFARQRELAKNN